MHGIHSPRTYTNAGRMTDTLILFGFWSSRITQADRIVYSINGDKIEVQVMSAKGHYGDK